MTSNEGSEDLDGAVGYRRPPKKHRWSKGTSGNPKGRPKGVKNRKTVLQKILERKIPMQDSGKRVSVSFIEALYLRIANDALRGNLKSVAFLLSQAEALGVEFAPAEPPKDYNGMTAQEMLAELKKRHEDRRRRNAAGDYS